MRALAACLLLCLTASLPAGAQSLGGLSSGGESTGGVSSGDDLLERVIDCRAAAEIAERAEGLPPGLLFAIGQIETGRPNPATGAIEPWPWSANQGGIDHYFKSAEDAIAWTSQTQAQGLTSIDVGCFQINLFYHQEAFATLEEAFDPLANALYAARFLAALHRRAGGWPLAVAQYHSADPALGSPYGERVYSAWNGIWPGLAGIGVGGFGRAGLTARASNVPDPFVIRISVQALGVRVVLPAWASRPAPPVAIPALGRAGDVRTATGGPTIAGRGRGGERSVRWPAPMIGATGAAPRAADPVVVRMTRAGLPRVYEPSGPVSP